VSATSGLVIVDKPGGMTSHDVVARVRRLAGTRKVGHAGTLDPMATGVLVVGIERATRLLGHLMLTEKAYEATVRLGETTTTDDADGDVTATTPAAHLSDEQIRAAFAAQVGAIDQVPAAVSAIKVGGKRAYALSRQGKPVELAARRVTIYELAVAAIRRSPGVEADISLRCSAGTYVRAVARDAGAVLGVGGHLTALRRTAVGPYRLAGAHTPAQLAEDFTVLPISEAARAAFPSYDLDPAQAADVAVGRRLAVELDGLTAVFAPGGAFLALYEPAGEPAGEPSLARPVAVFTG
jgi:tRNA pseudouridine55 synthase